MNTSLTGSVVDNDELATEGETSQDESSDVRPLLTPNSRTGQAQEVAVYRSYKSRWVILAALVMLNFSNGMIWITFSPIADVTADFYNISAQQLNWFSLVFIVLSIALALPSIWLLDSRGLKLCMHLGAWLNALGCGLRAVSPIIPMPYVVALTGQIVAAAAQPLMLFSPTKLAGKWFPDNQRALANTFGSMANPLGIMVANLMAPLIVQTTHQIYLMLLISCIPASLGLLLTLFGVRRALPPTPPSPSAAAHHVHRPFMHGLRDALSSRPLQLLALAFGSGIGLFTALSTLLEQMLCPLGYSNLFSGISGALLFSGGLVGAAVVGVWVDRTKLFQETAKVCFCLACLSYLALAELVRYPDLQPAIICAILALGAFGFSLFPLCMELSVECTYPIPEASSSGLLGLFGQVLSLVCIVVMQVLARPLDSSRSVCHGSGVTPQDFTVSNLGVGGVTLFIIIMFVVFFRCPYFRIESELKVKRGEPALIVQVPQSV